MKNKPFVICRKAGCNSYTQNANRYCDKHQESDTSQKWSHNPQAKRFYNSKRWEAIRDQKLKADPLCQRCSGRHNPIIATLVHHIDEDTNNNAPDNLMSLCHDCHEIIHRRMKDALPRKNGKPRLMRLSIGLDW